MDQIGFFNTDTNTYNCHFCPTTNLVQATVSIPGVLGSKIVIFQVPAQTDIEALEKVSDAISTGTLK
jgi:hypothetical protein